jgi:peptide/nickel transport system permease protein
MLAYLGRRLLGAIPLLLGILTLIFFVIHLAPGDPATRFTSPNVAPEVVEQIRRNLGLDQPVHVQYGKWLWSFVRGDFGMSFGQMRPISQILFPSRDCIAPGECTFQPGVLLNTLQLTLVSLVVIFAVGMLVGIVQAVRQYSWADNLLTVVALFFYSMPTFWFALMLILIFSLKANTLGLWHLPASGMTSVEYDYLTAGEQIKDRLLHLLLSATALGIGSAAGVARYMRGSMLEVIHQDFIRTARAKGLSERTVIFKHALRNALIPIITLLGLYLPFLLSGAVLVETIFGWPGMGRALVDAILQRDYPMVMATSFVISAMVVLGNLLSDVLYAVVDPRIRAA